MLHEFLQKLLALLSRKDVPGWLPDPVDSRDAQWEMFFSATAGAVPKSINWISELKLKKQGASPFCFLPDTKILLEDFSTRKIKDIKKGEIVFTHLGNKGKVTEIMTREWQGNLFEINVYGNYKSIICTPEHPIYVKRNKEYQFIEAKDILKSDFVVVPTLSSVEKDCTTKEIYKNPLFLELLGWYLAEGFVELERKRGNGSRVCFTLGGGEMNYAERISDLTKVLFGVEGIIRKNKHNGITIEYGGKKIIEESLYEMGGKGAREKRIHPSLMFLSPVLQLEIAKSWFLGDGHFGVLTLTRTTNHLSGVSISKTLVEQIHRILLRNGIKASITSRPGKIYENETIKIRQNAYDVHVYGNEVFKVFPEAGWTKVENKKPADVGRMVLDGDNLLCKIRKIRKLVPKRSFNKKTHYSKNKNAELELSTYQKSYVYNLKVEGDNSYIAENIAVHNCVSFGSSHIQVWNQKVKDGWIVDLSPRFLASRGGTSPKGANIRSVLEILRKEGCVLESECSFDPDTFRWADFWKILNISFLGPSELERAKRNRIAGYATIEPWKKEVIKQALQSGPVLVGLYLRKSWSWGGIVQPLGPASLGHVVVLAGYDDDKKCWIIGDSLEPQVKYVSYDYPFASVYVLADLPDNYQELQTEHLYNSYSRLLKERFGKPRDFANEQGEAALLAKLIRPLVAKRPELGGVLGKYWIVGVACFYGGWSLQDFIDDCVYYADTGGKHKYNFNEEKPE